VVFAPPTPSFLSPLPFPLPLPLPPPPPLGVHSGCGRQPAVFFCAPQARAGLWDQSGFEWDRVTPVSLSGARGPDRFRTGPARQPVRFRIGPARQPLKRAKSSFELDRRPAGGFGSLVSKRVGPVSNLPRWALLLFGGCRFRSRPAAPCCGPVPNLTRGDRSAAAVGCRSGSKLDRWLRVSVWSKDVFIDQGRRLGARK